MHLSTSDGLILKTQPIGLDLICIFKSTCCFRKGDDGILARYTTDKLVHDSTIYAFGYVVESRVKRNWVGFSEDLAWIVDMFICTRGTAWLSTEGVGGT